MTSIAGVSVRLGLFAVGMVVLLVGVISAITRPVPGDTDTFTAMFTDANGLKTGDDVRMFGVQVGKVGEIGLSGGQAEVRMSVQRSHPVYDTSTLVIRYQSLTGQRYLDIRQPAVAGHRLATGTTIGTEHTVPSFDITTLFNGLQPVLADFSPAALNQLAQSVLAVVEGNGTGIGPALDAIERLSRYVTDRQTVISALVRNLGDIAGQLGGRSPHLETLIAGLTDLFTVLEQKVYGLVDFAVTAPGVLGPIDSLAATLGLNVGYNADADALIRTAIPDPDTAVQALGRLPGLLQSLNTLIPATGPGVDLTCSRGRAEVPGVVAVLIDGRRISICNR
jgi:phospholipid/cholesterol/gamma-HCH transport system substrate-binding protein